MNSHCFKLYRIYSISFDSYKCWRIFLELNSKRLYRSSKKEEESRCLVYTSSTKRKIRKFHVVVVQRRQRKVQKSVQSCCFSNLNGSGFFCCSCCRRRRCCFNSLMSPRGGSRPGGGGAHPLHPPPRSAPVTQVRFLTLTRNNSVGYLFSFLLKKQQFQTLIRPTFADVRPVNPYLNILFM